MTGFGINGLFGTDIATADPALAAATRHPVADQIGVYSSSANEMCNGAWPVAARNAAMPSGESEVVN